MSGGVAPGQEHSSSLSGSGAGDPPVKGLRIPILQALPCSYPPQRPRASATTALGTGVRSTPGAALRLTGSPGEEGKLHLRPHLPHARAGPSLSLTFHLLKMG